MNLDHLKIPSECIDECPSLDPTSFELAAGEELVTTTSGCCSFLEKKCVEANCPAETECPSHLVKALNLTTKDDCCKHFYCGEFVNMQYMQNKAATLLVCCISQIFCSITFNLN